MPSAAKLGCPNFLTSAFLMVSYSGSSFGWNPVKRSMNTARCAFGVGGKCTPIASLDPAGAACGLRAITHDRYVVAATWLMMPYCSSTPIACEWDCSARLTSASDMPRRMPTMSTLTAAGAAGAGAAAAGWPAVWLAAATGSAAAPGAAVLSVPWSAAFAS
jgi:hypothetical protein